jgi:hypothetical protein
MPTPIASRIASALVLAGLFAFLALHIAAAVAFPGGTSCDAGATRYQVWGNFLCDVTQPHTPAGIENARASRLGTASFVVIAAAFIPFWWLVARMVGGAAGWVVRVLGTLSALGTLVVPGFPSARWPLPHVAAVFTASIPGLTAAVVGSAALLRARGLVPGLLGAATLVAGTVDAVGYGRAMLHGTHCTPWLAPAQKVAALVFIAWMASVAVLAARDQPARRVDSSR